MMYLPEQRPIAVPLAVMARFWSHVEFGAPDACWPWCGSLCSGGRYAAFFWEGRTWRAGRFLWAAMGGHIPAQMMLRHTCDNGMCINPAHFVVGTHAQNMTDRKERGRTHRTLGEEHYMTTLSAAQVREIRVLVNGPRTLRQIGDMYGVGLNVIWSIKHRKTWGWLPDEMAA